MVAQSLIYIFIQFEYDKRWTQAFDDENKKDNEKKTFMSKASKYIFHTYSVTVLSLHLLLFFISSVKCRHEYYLVCYCLWYTAVVRFSFGRFFLVCQTFF